MSYIEDISQLHDTTISDVIDVCRKYISPQYRNYPWSHPEINHGISTLESEEALYCYMVSYGEMHEIKCKSVMRSLPLDTLSSNIEVVDWGCGQGVGSMCLVDMLRDRDKLHLLRKITLIEPSKPALNRARVNITSCTAGNVIINPINQFMPSTEHNHIKLHYSYNTIIHIFSNILDITSIDLKKVAALIHTDENKTHFIVCIGPKNFYAYRIDQFTDIFHPQTLITSIDSPLLGYTRSTQHPFSCYAKCFEYLDEPLSLDADTSIKPITIDGSPILDDYDARLAVQNGIVSESANSFVDKLKNIISANDYVYYSPNINDDKPDIVIVRPNIGIFIVQFFDESFINLEHKPSAIDRLRALKNNIIKLHLDRVSEQRVINKSLWTIVHTIGYFVSDISTAAIRSKLNPSNYEHLYSSHDFDNNNFANELDWNRRNRNFDSIVQQGFIGIISPGWHSYKEGRSINLSTVQKDLVYSNAKQQKIKGTAGSGKTEVLVHRAVEEQRLSNEKVLILTYNLALKNYIKYRLACVRADFAWDMFQINNYHQLIKSTANNLGIDVTMNPWDDIQALQLRKDRVPKYAAIFIDEVQNYKSEWLHILRENFLSPHGKFIVFGDPKQNIYKRELDANGDINLGIIGGSWNGSLLKGYRYVNPLINQLISSYQQQYFDYPDNIEHENQLNFSLGYEKLEDISPENIANACLNIMQENRLAYSDTIILFETHNLIREVDFLIRKAGVHTITTSESKEQYDAILEQNIPVEDELEDVRKAKKLHFKMQPNVLKLSTIDSYIGWEAENVILVIEQDNKNFVSKERIYTGITRAKNYLHIVSLGNPLYDSFFQSLV